MITDYYRLQILPENDGKKTVRFDTVASTGSYKLFEEMAAKSKVNRFFCYYNGVPDTFSDRARQNAERAITKSGCNISSVFVPDPTKPLMGFGDIKGSMDALLVFFSQDYKIMELFIIRGQKFNKRALYNLMVTGHLNQEIQEVRNQAVSIGG
jgi:hypothetical protein